MQKEYKIYLAGPMVFSPDAEKIAEQNKELCEKYGYIGLTPLDNSVDFSKSPLEISKEIFRKNLDLMEQADIFVGNLENFRGAEPDSGSVWELAYMFGEGKPCYAYLHSYPKTYLQKTVESGNFRKFIYGMPVDNNGYKIENIGGVFNCMLENSLDGIYKTLEECLIRLKDFY